MVKAYLRPLYLAVALFSLLLLVACGGTQRSAPAAPGDIAVQAVSATSPENGALGVAADSDITLSFSEAADQSAVERGFTLYQGSYDPSANPSEFSPLALTFICNGTWKVTNPNEVPLSFEWVTDKNNERSVGVVGANAVATFYSVTNGNKVNLYVGGAVQDVEQSYQEPCNAPRGSFEWSGDLRSVSYTPLVPFAVDTDYSVVLSTAVQDLDEPFLVQFSTRQEESGTATETIGIEGGVVRLGDAIIQVPAGAVITPTDFAIERLGEAPAPLPENREVVASHKFSSTSSEEFSELIQIVIPVDPTSLPDEDVIVELYSWDGSEYTKIRISEGTNAFLVEASSLSDQTFVAGRAEKATLENDCSAQGGVFNGRYCQLPFPNDSSNGQSLMTQAVGDYKILSFNVGNLGSSGTFDPAYCLTNYAVKLCSYAVEERVRNALVQDNPDIIAFQEIWHSDCFYVEEPTFGSVAGVLIQDPYADRVCSDTSVQITEQIERLLADQNGTSQYAWRCTEEERLPTIEKTINGYECVAIRKGLFEFATTLVDRPAPIQPPCDPGNASPDQNYAGRDTGFQVESVRLLNTIGSFEFAEFDVVNTHLIGSGPCRLTQLRAFRERYYAFNPVPKRLLILGDFNIDPVRLSDSGTTQSYFNRIFSARDTAVDYFLTFRSAYMISNPNQITQILRSLDHVLSNFADGSCIRGGIIFGVDHR